MTAEPGALVRVHGWRGCGRVTRVDGNEVTVWFGDRGRASMRTTTLDRVQPARRGDNPPPAIPAAPNRKVGR